MRRALFVLLCGAAVLSGAGIRVDSGVRSGSVVSGHYDSLLAKLIVHGEDRNQALRRARAARSARR